MSSIQKNLKKEVVVAVEGAKVGIVQSQYNTEITDALFKSCVEELKKAGISEDHIFSMQVPGSWELAMGAEKMIERHQPDVVVTLGHILKGETKHFDFIAMACAHGIMGVSLKTGLPVIFGVLTTDTMEQATARIKGGSAGDKGVEAAQAAIQMLNL